MGKRLIFIYNTKGNLFSSVTDAVHKIISPDTYKCSLCAITYGSLTMRREWRDFIKSLEIKVEFLHSDELKKRYPKLKIKLPAAIITRKANTTPKLLISASEMNKAKTIIDLKRLVKTKLRISTNLFKKII